ncbi:MAG: bifunctional N-acetylglucosamine-1-phosphate uridyltransferase/glucosamine-1-phosphate acetyltransferase [Candidatus Omnitrophica bacterium]|nr:bifunctional N-acetylglucosamine-1-phosphate uridyltransferase/glucosamine-1-phosphate acetyltransferase [Candidatus Omnitrophota bacterium]
MKDIVGIVLAAGEGTRMKSDIPKVLHKICGKPMLKYMLDLLGRLQIDKNIVIVGHQSDKVKTIFKNKTVKTVTQPRLLGSGDAVWQARKSLFNFKGNVLIVYGDTPLVTYKSLSNLIQAHRANQAACTILTAQTKNPTGFGRIIRSEDNRIVRIIEEQDADPIEKAIGEINVGVYCFKASELFPALEEIKPNNAKKEYYLTDAIKVLTSRKAKVESVSAEDEHEAVGVNSRLELSRANEIINKRHIEELMQNGITIVSPATTFISTEAEIGRDTVIEPHTIIEGEVRIGASCHIGPFARIRSGSILQDRASIGNFVEIVRSKIGAGSKVKHHSYIGDAILGKGVNIGAGTITANYDGKNKNRTVIEDGAFVGVGSILIAPVKIGKGAVTGAGSVVTKNKNVPAGKTVVGIPARVLKKKSRGRKVIGHKS